MTRNSFGRFVIKKALTITDDTTKNTIIEIISNAVNELNDPKLFKKWQMFINITPKVNLEQELK
jgi:hypothetical protein